MEAREAGLAGRFGTTDFVAAGEEDAGAVAVKFRVATPVLDFPSPR